MELLQVRSRHQEKFDAVKAFEEEMLVVLVLQNCDE